MACAQYFGSDSVVKPYNPYAAALNKSASVGTNAGGGGYSARLESTGLNRGLSNVGLAEAGGLPGAGRSPSMR